MSHNLCINIVHRASERGLVERGPLSQEHSVVPSPNQRSSSDAALMQPWGEGANLPWFLGGLPWSPPQPPLLQDAIDIPCNGCISPAKLVRIGPSVYLWLRESLNLILLSFTQLLSSMHLLIDVCHTCTTTFHPAIMTNLLIGKVFLSYGSLLVFISHITFALLYFITHSHLSSSYDQGWRFYKWQGFPTYLDSQFYWYVVAGGIGKWH